MKSLNKLSTTLKVRLSSSFLQELVSAAFLPFIAIYLSDMISPLFSGIFLTTLVLATFPLAIAGGYLTDRLPKKKFILSLQLLMFVSLAGMAISLTTSFDSVLIFCFSYVIFHLTWGLQFPAMSTVIMDAITPENESIVYKIDYWLTNVAVAIGTLLGGLLYSQHQLFLVTLACVIFFVVYVMLWRGLPKDSIENNSKQTPITKSNNIIREYFPVLKDTRYMVYTIAFSFILTAELTTSSYVAIRLNETFKVIEFLSIQIDGVRMFSVLMLVNTLIVIFFTYFISRKISNFNTKYVLIFGLLFYCVGYSNIVFLNNFSLLVIFMVIATVGEIIYGPIFEEEKYKMTPPDKRGVYSGINNIGFTFSELLARLGIVLGTLTSAYFMAFTMFFLLLLGGILMYLAIYIMKKK